MNHERLQIHALADGELSGEEKVAAEKHLADCPSCRAEYEAICAVKGVLKDRLEPVDASSAWSQCSKRLDEIDRSKRVETFVTRHAWSLCSVFLVIILSAAMLNRTLGHNSVRAGDLAQMAAGMAPLTGPSSQNPAEIRRWVSDEVGDVPMNLQPRKAQVIEAAATSLNGHKMLRLTLRDDVGVFALMIVSNAVSVDGFDPMDSGHRYDVGKIGNANCVAWTDGNCALVVVGDRSIRNLCLIADSISIR
jgi:anti-sigma factor RsiW